MTDISIKQLAMELGVSVDYLIQRFSNIGIVKSKLDDISLSEKEMLYKYINDSSNSSVNQLTLQRKTRSTLSISSVGGKSKQIQIEVRKKRTYVQGSSSKVFESVNTSSQLVLGSNIRDKLVGSLIEENRLTEKKVDNVVRGSSLLALHNNTINCISSELKLKHKDISKVVRRVNNIQNSEKKLDKISNTSFQKSNSDRCSDDNNQLTSIRISEREKCNKSNDLEYVTLLEERNNNRKLDNDHRRHRVRSRSRSSGGKQLQSISSKQRRNNTNHHRLLYETMVNGFDREEELLCPHNSRMNRIKRKQSILIQSFNKPAEMVVHNVVIGETISVSELASKMSMKSSHVIKEMMKLGLMVTINQIIDQETAQLVVEEMGHNVILRRSNELEESIMNDRKDSMKTDNHVVFENRAPIVTIMGHVDHGKTSLLDYIRSSKITCSETGGITQKIGAYHVRTRSNDVITFIDTPGHAAFSAMRSRGVQLTDIVVLVVASDDGVMPQTVEAIEYVKTANVPVIVAINKIDKLESNPERVKNELNNYGLIPEEWGGDTQCVNISALSGQGINDLLDAIILQSEILELRVMTNGMASAIVIESFLDKGRGPVVTVLVREGTLKCGDIILCGTEYGRVRAMRNECGCTVILAGPSIPVELVGLSGSPAVGEVMVVVRDEKKARELALYRQGKFRDAQLTLRRKESNKVKLDNIFDNIKHSGNISDFNIIIKSDTLGSIEAICQSVVNLSTDTVAIKVVSSSIGGINESDVSLAITSHAIILGFNVKADTTARRIIDIHKLNVRYYTVIYDLLDDIQKMINDMITPRCIRKVIGLAEVRSVFHSPKYGSVVGCIVVEGSIKKNKRIKIIRDHTVIYEGELESLRRFKTDVSEVRNGIECGIGMKKCNDVRAGDTIEVFENITVPSYHNNLKNISY